MVTYLNHYSVKLAELTFGSIPVVDGRLGHVGVPDRGLVWNFDTSFRVFLRTN